MSDRMKLKKRTSNLGKAGVPRLCGWNPKDRSTGWLKKLKDMAANRGPWR